MQRFQLAVGLCIAQVQVRNRPGASPQLAGLCFLRGTFERHKSSLNSGTSPVVSNGLQLSCCQAVVPEPGQTNAGLFFSKDEKSPPPGETDQFQMTIRCCLSPPITSATGLDCIMKVKESLMHAGSCGC